MLCCSAQRLVEQVYGGLHDTHSDTSNQARPFLIGGGSRIADGHGTRGGCRRAAAQPVPPTASTHDQIVITGTRRTDRTVTNSASPIDVISSTGTGHPADREPARHGQEHRSVLLSSRRTRFRTRRASCARRRCAACPATKCWCRSTASASTARRWSRSIPAATPACRSAPRVPTSRRFPSIAIKNLQVLRDGATAQYGSDAIAGVMNFGMRNDRNDLELQARYGQYYRSRPDQARQRQEPADRGHGRVSGSAQPASSTSPANGYKDDGTSRGKTRPIAAIFAQQITRALPTSCPIIRCRFRSGAHRRSMAGREWSTPASTSPTTASSI